MSDTQQLLDLDSRETFSHWKTEAEYWAMSMGDSLSLLSSAPDDPHFVE
jgi:hypothetical protein